MFLALLSKVVGCPHNDDGDNMGRKVGRLVALCLVFGLNKKVSKKEGLVAVAQH